MTSQLAPIEGRLRRGRYFIIVPSRRQTPIRNFTRSLKVSLNSLKQSHKFSDPDFENLRGNRDTKK
jgi:hypothetical protein